ncbi:unnamed protein product [Bursaphelenchus xylophilus]|uniref:(pine wood nematode) hypothetical protein n=1 Tax=Bursaphelenchus xylophilus TaxID=6326 RepID=A0A1I7SDQ3_BURXY|nr:unnamed protein product [Bursaphelenchus xylophilus]CAG9084435.1 unnamed protein product [Bursaphelenchus xylophilus]
MEKRLEAITKKDEFLNLAQRLLEESDSSDDDVVCINADSSKENLKRPKKFESKEGGISGTTSKRRRRDKDEIEAEKNNKLLAKIERENQVAKNSKCEQYLYCYCSRLVTLLDPSIPTALNNIFNERKITQQLKVEDVDKAIVLWKRKKIAGKVVDNKVEREEHLVTQHPFLLVIDGETFDVVASTGLVEFVNGVLREHKTGLPADPHLTIAVLGHTKTNATQIHFLSFDLFEKTQTQLRFVKSPGELCLLIAQMHRAIAKYMKKEERGDEIHLDTDKGIPEGPKLIEDWWNRMLGLVHRMTEDCRRAIVRNHPNPFVLMDKLDTMPAGEGMQYLSEIRTENGRFLGPALAQKLFFILTSEDGKEVLDKQ